MDMHHNTIEKAADNTSTHNDASEKLAAIGYQCKDGSIVSNPQLCNKTLGELSMSLPNLTITDSLNNHKA